MFNIYVSVQLARFVFYLKKKSVCVYIYIYFNKLLDRLASCFYSLIVA